MADIAPELPKRPVHPPLCQRCGYDLTGLRIDTPCPECGEPIFRGRDLRGPSGRAWLALVVTAVAAALMPCTFGIGSIVMSVVAVVLAVRADERARGGLAPLSDIGMCMATVTMATLVVIASLLLLAYIIAVMHW